MADQVQLMEPFHQLPLIEQEFRLSESPELRLEALHGESFATLLPPSHKKRGTAHNLKTNKKILGAKTGTAELKSKKDEDGLENGFAVDQAIYPFLHLIIW